MNCPSQNELRIFRIKVKYLTSVDILQPGAPVVARAAFLLEVAHFIHRCNMGAWPAWIKMSLPMYRPSMPHGRTPPSGARRINILQRAAGRMFYQWAEVTFRILIHVYCFHFKNVDLKIDS